MAVLHLDFETASGVDLKTVGVENYCMHRDFEVTATAWAFDDNPVQALTWPDTDNLPAGVFDHLAAGGIVKAWNAAFERAILRYRYNVLVPHEQMDCVMQRASAWGLPMSLQDAGDVLNVPTVKDRRARSLMLMMGKPRKDGSYWHKDPDPAAQKRLADLTAYCMADVDAERALDEVIPPLAKFEKLLSVADAQINQKGVMVDLAAVAALRKAVEIERARIDVECAVLTGGAVTSPGTQTAKLVAWLTAEGWGSVTDLTKATITELLARTSGHVPVGAVRRVLFLRQLAARASVAKLDKMEGWASVIDDRARNLLQFYGAGRTGRWAGRGIQVQNLPRPPKGLDVSAVIKVAQVDPGALGLFDADPLKAISGSLRGCLIPAPGNVLVSIDFSQIEARVLAWLAGQDDVVKAFANNIDVYTMQAAKVGSGDRQLGKVLVLACGYGMGASKFQETALADYGLALSDREALKAHTEWRRNNSRIVHFWYDMEDMVGRAVQHPGTEVWLADHTVPPYSQAGGHGVAARVKGRVLELRKPNGVKLSYHNMRYESGGLVFDGVNGITKKWGTERTYGGRLVENLVQSVARDVMAEGILTADRLPIMTVHDEIVWEVPEEISAWTADGLRNTVETVPVWAPGLPLASDVKILRRYGK